MTRAEFKKQLGVFRPSLIRPEMLFKTLSERKLMRLEERALMRYEREKLAIYNDRSLTDDQRSALWHKASELRWAAFEKLRPLRRLCEQMRERRIIKQLTPMKKHPGAMVRRRMAA